MTIAEVVMRGFSDLCRLSSSVEATMDGVVINVIGDCLVLGIETPTLRAAGKASFLGFLIVCLYCFVMIEGAAVIVVKSLHSLWVSVSSVGLLIAAVDAGLLKASIVSGVGRTGSTFSEL